MKTFLGSRLVSRSMGATTLAFFLGFLGAPGSTQADLTVQWKITDGGNDHYYQFVDFGTNTSWTTARDYGASQTNLGSTGHLVSITSQAEDSFLQNTFGSFIGDPNTGVPGIYAWIGLTDIDSPGSYHWITGEALTYTNWAPTEPNFPDIEHYVHLWTRKFTNGSADPNGTPLWSWNNAGDAPFGSDPPAYSGAIIEFDGPFVTTVPEPSTIAVAGLGGVLALAYAGCHKRRSSSGP